jgi:transcriptional regulator with XRE-family HTH domain
MQWHVHNQCAFQLDGNVERPSMAYRSQRPPRSSTFSLRPQEPDDDVIAKRHLKRLGERIAARRVALNLTQQELAERLGATAPEVVSRYERGLQEPRFTLLLRLAAALEVDPGWLLGSPGATLANDFETIAVLLGELRDRHPERLGWLPPVLRGLIGS